MDRGVHVGRAGLEAGLIYNTFPTMHGQWIPDGLFSLSPFYLNFFENMVTVQFEVGEEMTPSLVKVNDKLESNMDRIPPGVQAPLVKAKGIDDVPVVTLTLWSEKDYNGEGPFPKGSCAHGSDSGL